MRMLILGPGDLRVSELCLGTMYLGTTTDWGTSYRLLDRYVEAGGSFLDTANIYAHWVSGGEAGVSESLLGRWLAERGHRNKMFIASKVGFAYPGCEGGSGPPKSGTSAKRACAGWRWIPLISTTHTGTIATRRWRRCWLLSMRWCRAAKCARLGPATMQPGDWRKRGASLSVNIGLSFAASSSVTLFCGHGRGLTPARRSWAMRRCWITAAAEGSPFWPTRH